MGEEEVLSIIKRHPEVIIEALERKPELLINFMIKLAPWDKFATKEDVKMIIELINKRFEDVNKRFEDLKYYVDKRVSLIEKLLIAFNIPILTVVLTILVKLFIP